VKDPMILLSKQLDHLIQSNGMENVDSEIQSHAYQNEVCHLAVVTSIAWLAEKYLQTLLRAATTITTNNNNNNNNNATCQRVVK
jgi:uncharacterized protein (DUF2342 family)